MEIIFFGRIYFETIFTQKFASKFSKFTKNNNS